MSERSPGVEAYNIIEETSQFSLSKQKFETLIRRLNSEDVCQMDHSALETLVDRDGREILRQLYQDHLDLRASQEEKHDVIQGSDGKYRNHRREGEIKKLRVVFGDVEVTRISYEGREMSSLKPLDAKLNLPDRLCSYGVQRHLVEHAIQMSFGATGEQMEGMTGVHVSKRAIEKSIQNAAQDFDAFYSEDDSGREKGKECANDLLVMSSDGKGVVVRKSDLREETRKRAEREKKQKRKKRLTPGQKKNRKRMAVVGAVYGTERNIRTPEEVMGPSEPEASDNNVVPLKPKRTRPKNKRVWASLEKDADVVMDQIFEEGMKRDPEKKRQWVYIADGDLHQLARVEDFATLYGVATLAIICDFVHVLEYLWDASHCFNKVGSDEAEQWVYERGMKILKGDAIQVAAGIRRSATKRGLTKKEAKAAEKCARYLLNHKEYLRYDEYLAKGYPIASGVIEGTCRHLINDRLDLTGARWSLIGAESILKLRSLWASKDLDTYWDFHKSQEYERNHAAYYAETSVS
jgi:hypothetical protein